MKITPWFTHPKATLDVYDFLVYDQVAPQRNINGCMKPVTNVTLYYLWTWSKWKPEYAYTMFIGFSF